MCIRCKKCKKAGISIEEGGLSTDTQETQQPSNVTTSPRWRQPKLQVRQKEVESLTNVVTLTSYLDDEPPNVAMIQIGSGNAI